MENKKVIAFDIDGCITEHRVMGEMIKKVYPTFDYDKHMSFYNVQDSLLNHGFVYKIDSDFVSKLYEDIIDKTSCPNTPLTKGFVEFYNELLATDKFKILFVSARKNTLLEIRKTHELLIKNNIKFDIADVYHVDKAENKQLLLSALKVDMLFEDNLDTAVRFAISGKKTVSYLIDTPYNQVAFAPSRLIREKDFTNIHVDEIVNNLFGSKEYI